MEIKLTYNVTDETIINLFSDMCEGAGYWASLGKHYPKTYKNGKYLEEKLFNWVNDGETFMIVDKEAETEYPINLQTIERGLQVMADVFPDDFKSAMNYDDDTITGDVFLQCCCFPDEIEKDREIIYA